MSYRYNRHGPDGKFIKAAPVPPLQQLLQAEAVMRVVDAELESMSPRPGRVTVTEMPSEPVSDNNASVPIPLWVLLGAAGGWCLAQLVNLACSR